MITATPPVRFELPADLLAAAPPEDRGLARDQVRLLVTRPDGLIDARFHSLADHVAPGDLLVVNTSQTMAAALRGNMRGEPVVVHLSVLRDDGDWVIELRRPDHSGPILGGLPHEVVRLAAGGSVRLVEPSYGTEIGATRLWRAEVTIPQGVRRFTDRYGQPIRYSYLDREWPLSMYQTVFADPTAWPGSAEMPSAGRPFTMGVMQRLRSRRVEIAPIRLDTGVSSLEAGEPPYPEKFNVPPRTAAAVNRVRAAGGRVIAVGTTVTRALESAADETGSVSPATGWTDLVLGISRPTRVVDGLITGFHPPDASHLELLQAVAGSELVAAAYEKAPAAGYLWHEFGDSCLLLPQRPAEMWAAA
ncbi:MAG: S-adenosylmethionine:tRNA ribosyltransferase-isomerase [Acidimicrobiia bacterium]|nr:S-adenosylmethionine:tRNA ribosyltransferase-isomerase [Acidimicrobiia bacterium]